ncbi:MAG: hypothetical protein R3B98_04175 [Hyphomonas sp.]
MIALDQHDFERSGFVQVADILNDACRSALVDQVADKDEPVHRPRRQPRH